RDPAARLTGGPHGQPATAARAVLGEHGRDFSARAIARLRGRLGGIRQAAETTTLNPDMRARLGNALVTAEAAVERWPLQAVTFDQVADQLTRFYRDARRLIPEQWSQAADEELHELRKRVVIHRYQ